MSDKVEFSLSADSNDFSYDNYDIAVNSDGKEIDEISQLEHFAKSLELELDQSLLDFDEKKNSKTFHDDEEDTDVLSNEYFAAMLGELESVHSTSPYATPNKSNNNNTINASKIATPSSSGVENFLKSLRNNDDSNMLPRTPIPLTQTSKNINSDDFFSSALHGSHDSKDSSPYVIPQARSKSIDDEVNVNLNAHLGVSTSTDSDDLSPAPRQTKAKKDEVVEDLRLQGDLSSFHYGDRLANDGLKIYYSGIFETALNQGSHYSVQVVECVIRPDAPLKSLMKVVCKAAEGRNLYFTQVQRSQVIISNPPMTQGPWKNSEWDLVDCQVCISRELKQRVLLFQFMVKNTPFQGVQSSVSLEESPNTLLFVQTVQKLLAEHRLSLSCLYTEDVSNILNGGLDAHFKAQLHTLCREGMWNGLVDGFSAMDEHTRAMEMHCARFMATLEPVYKQHNITIPTPPVRRKVTDFPLRIDPAALGSVDNLDDEEEDENEFQLDGSLISTSMSTSTSRRGSVKNSVETYNLKQQSASENEMTNGMTLCLENLHRILGILQRRCDKELTARLQQKNEYTVAVITDLYEYRKRMLTFISESPEAQASPLNNTYVNLFHGVPISLPPKPSEVPIVRNLFSAFMNKEGKSNETKINNDTNEVEKSDNVVPMDDYVDVDSNNSASENNTPKTISTLTSWLFSSKEDSASTPKPASDKKNSTEKRPSFVPSIGRLPTSAKLVKERLEAYRKLGENNKDKSESIERNATTNSIDVIEANKDQVSLPTQPRDVVLFYCACLISGTPGTLYLTPYLVCFAFGVLGITSSKEAYPLTKLDSVGLPEKNSVLSSNALKLQFYNGAKSIAVAPVVMECQRLRAILLDAKDCFEHLSLPLNFNIE